MNAFRKSLPVVFAVAFLLASEAQAQYVPAPPPLKPVETMDLSGPRVGMTFLDTGVRAQLLADRKIDLGPVISQFGWQKERRFLSGPTGFTGVTEFVLLVGGMDQGVLLPSFNWLVGARTAQGLEFAVGPNVTVAGFGLAAAAGVTIRSGNLNIPVNFAVVPSKHGLRASMLVGFNSRTR
jgi:hypothetical protein